jgi:hypothetical protein
MHGMVNIQPKAMSFIDVIEAHFLNPSMEEQNHNSIEPKINSAKTYDLLKTMCIYSATNERDQDSDSDSHNVDAFVGSSNF